MMGGATRRRSLGPLLALCAVAALPASASAAVTGFWVTDEQDGIIEIKQCGRTLCGYIRAVLNSYGEKPPFVDRLNEDASLRSRAICGLPVIGQLEKLAGDTWGNGWVYDPKRGRTFNLEITQSGPDRLTLHGYAGVRFLGKTVVWTRAQSRPAACH
jgi:uncharacterized protein (DUF2147 family)